MLASIPSATLLGARASRHRRGPRRQRPARLPHRRPARRGVPRVARPRPRGGAASGLAWPTKRITVNLAPSGVAQERRRARPGDRRRRARRQRAAAGRRRRRARRSSASSGSTARPARPGRGADGRRARRRRRRRAGGAASPRRRSRRSRRRCAWRRPTSRAGRRACRCEHRGPTIRPPAPSTDEPLRPRPRRRPRPAGRPAGARGRRGRRPPPAARRPARVRQDDAGPAPARPAPAARAATLALEATMVHSAAGVPLPPGGLVRRPPFRAPHHTTLGRRPGRRRLERAAPGRDQPCATAACCSWTSSASSRPAVLDGAARAARGGRHPRRPRQCRAVELPARFLLVAATNPCPCGGGPPGACECDDGAPAALPAAAVRSAARSLRPAGRRAAARRSTSCSAGDGGEPTAVVAARVEPARDVSPSTGPGVLNAELRGRLLDRFAPLTPGALAVLRDELERDRLTGRGYHRVRRVARTIADLDGDRRRADSVDVEPTSQLALSHADADRRVDADGAGRRDGDVPDATGYAGRARRVRADDRRRGCASCSPITPPDEAFAVAAVRRRPTPARRPPCSPDDRRAAWRASAAPSGRRRRVASGARRWASWPSPLGDPSFPALLRRRSAAAGGAVRPRRPRRARRVAGSASSAPATPRGRPRRRPRRSGAGSPRPGSPSCRAWPGASTARPTAARCAAGDAWRARRGGRQRSRRAYPRAARRALWSDGLRARGCCCRRGRPAPRRSRSASRCATASSPR